MLKILEFFDRIYNEENENDVIGNIRRYAEKHCVWDITLNVVFNYINDSKN